MLKAVLTHRRSAAGIGIGKTASVTATTGSEASLTTPAVATNASGSDFFVTVAWVGSTSTPTISDSEGNTYTLLSSITNATYNAGFGVWYKLNGVGGASHTVTVTANGATDMVAGMVEVTGSNHVIDQTHTGAITTGTGPYVSGNITTTHAHDLLLGFCGAGTTNFPQSLSSNAPLSLTLSQPDSSGVSGPLAISSEIVTTTQTVQASFSGSPYGAVGMCIITSVEGP